jgi:hypothetical protein
MLTGLPVLVVQVVVADVEEVAHLANKDRVRDVINLETVVAANSHKEAAPSAKGGHRRPPDPLIFADFLAKALKCAKPNYSSSVILLMSV